MHARKAAFAGRVRVMPIRSEYPLELLEFDEIGALTKYIDRKTRDAITEKLLCSPHRGGRWGSRCAAMSKSPPKTPSRSGNCSHAGSTYASQ